jgi:hypothetical protein
LVIRRERDKKYNREDEGESMANEESRQGTEEMHGALAESRILPPQKDKSHSSISRVGVRPSAAPQ